MIVSTICEVNGGFNMKIRRFLGLVIVIAFLIGSASTILAFANGSVKSGDPDVDATVMGSISFVNGTLGGIFPDNISYFARWSGTSTFMFNIEVTDVKAYVTAGTDKQTHASEFMYFGAETISRSNVGCGYGGVKGILKMYCAGATDTISSTN